jgi:hypothetical protein
MLIIIIQCFYQLYYFKILTLRYFNSSEPLFPNAAKLLNKRYDRKKIMCVILRVIAHVVCVWEYVCLCATVCVIVRVVCVSFACCICVCVWVHVFLCAIVFVIVCVVCVCGCVLATKWTKGIYILYTIRLPFPL